MPNDSDLHEGAHTDAPKEHADAGKGELTRRELIGIAAGAIVASPLARLEITAAANQEQAPHFFSREELEMVEILTDRIIPTDDHSPGARAAGVAAYIDGRLAESWEEQPRKVWRDGLKRVDALCQKMHGQPFLKATPEQQVAVLSRMAQNEFHPKSEEEKFFAELKRRTVTAYYTSEIGIHKEMEYKGNTLLKEFAGYEGS